jgi:ArsR family transcriptional regulator
MVDTEGNSGFEAANVTLLRGPITASQAARLAAILRALADPVRLRIVSIVATSVNCEACVCDLAGKVGLSQPTVSHHLKILTRAGIFLRRKQGVWSYYSLAPTAMDQLASTLTRKVDSNLNR